MVVLVVVVFCVVVVVVVVFGAEHNQLMSYFMFNFNHINLCGSSRLKKKSYKSLIAETILYRGSKLKR